MQSEGRKYRGDAFGHHRFSRTRRAYHDEVVPSGGSDFKRALYTFLTFDISEIEVEIILSCKKFGTCVDDRWCQFPLSVEKIDYLANIFHSVHVELVDDSSFSHICFGDDKAIESLCPGLYGNG